MTNIIDHGWADNPNEKIRTVSSPEVHSFLTGRFDVVRTNKHDLKNEKDPQNLEHLISKTYALNFGSACEGDLVDLFDLQKWFDDNREWINVLKEECET